MGTRMHRFRWATADWISRLACWLRGHKWYVADAWAGVPGNRANELQSQLHECLVIQTDFEDDSSMETLKRGEEILDELAQLAGCNWGHIWTEAQKTAVFQPVTK